MINSVYLYLRYVSISVRSQMQYKASFVMLSVSAFIINGLEFFGIWILFDRFKTIKGWSFAEIALLYGMVNVAFAISEAGTRGFDLFGRMVKSGDFDRLLVRPRSTIIQLLGQEIQLMRVGRFMQGLVAMTWGITSLSVQWTIAKSLLLIGSILGGACLFGGLFVLQATLSFWTVESLEVANTMTYGGVEATKYPISIYRPWLRRLFTFIVPLAFINYYPSLAILGRPGGYPLLNWIAPMIGVLFLVVSFQVWKIGVRHYCSTGS